MRRLALMGFAGLIAGCSDNSVDGSKTNSVSNQPPDQNPQVDKDPRRNRAPAATSKVSSQLSQPRRRISEEEMQMQIDRSRGWNASENDVEGQSEKRTRAANEAL